MKIVSAKDYGFRVVIRCVEDDSGQRWLHANGQPHTKETSVGADGDLVPSGLKAGTECHACLDAWVFHEFIFTGTELIDPETHEPWSAAQYLVQVKARAASLLRGPSKSLNVLLGAEVM